MRLRWLTGTVAVLAAILSLAGCTQPIGPSTKAPLSLVRFRAEPNAFMAFSGLDQAQSFVVRDRDAWQRTWNEIHGRLSPVPALPDIDFSREMVVVAALGNRPSSGYDVVFTGASETNGIVTLDVETRSPGPRCVTLTVITAPLDLARIPKRDGLVLFQPTPTVVNCS